MKRNQTHYPECVAKIKAQMERSRDHAKQTAEQSAFLRERINASEIRKDAEN